MEVGYVIALTIYLLGVGISGIYVILTKSKEGKFYEVPWKKMGTQLLMSVLPVINYFPIREIFNGEWKK